MTAPHDLSRRIADVLAIDPAAPAIEFDRRWYTWGELGETADALSGIVERGAQVGVLLHNTPVSVGLLLGVLVSGGCVVTINPSRGIERTRDDVASLDLAVIAGDPDDLETFVQPTRLTTASARDLGATVTVRSGTAAAPLRTGTAIRMLTSGTTGPPKRVDLTYSTLERVMMGAKQYETSEDHSIRLRRGVAIVNSPLVHLGGVFRILQCITDGRSFALLPKFTVDGWVDVVRRHRPATASLVPTALRMVLESDTDPADLTSIRSVISGTAPLDPDDADAFLERFGIPVLVNYAATEFGGGVAGWNLADHREFWATKRGSAGRAHVGCDLRVVDPTTGDVCTVDAEGVLEVRADQLATTSWVRTTDLARIDADGFLWILGRADQAIIRGGFKVLPDDVRAALERHPAVRGAAVVGAPDRRLGAVPLAAVELRADAQAVSADELIGFLGGVLAPYEIPARLLVVQALPRTESGKPDLIAVGELFAADKSERD